MPTMRLEDIGQQQFGNTADGVFNACDGASFWKLPLIAGDQVTIDWESSPSSDGDPGATILYIWPIGTSDFSINNADPLNEFSIGSNGKAESKFTAGSSGSYPLMFQAPGCGSAASGAFDFTVYVNHRIVLSTLTVSRINAHGGRVTIGVHTADGQPISSSTLKLTLQGYWNKGWHPIGRQSARSGSVVFTLNLPAALEGSSIKVRVLAAGAGYLSNHTPTRSVRVS